MDALVCSNSSQKQETNSRMSTQPHPFGAPRLRHRRHSAPAALSYMHHLDVHLSRMQNDQKALAKRYTQCVERLNDDPTGYYAAEAEIAKGGVETNSKHIHDACFESSYQTHVENWSIEPEAEAGACVHMLRGIVVGDHDCTKEVAFPIVCLDENRLFARVKGYTGRTLEHSYRNGNDIIVSLGRMEQRQDDFEAVVACNLDLKWKLRVALVPICRFKVESMDLTVERDWIKIAKPAETATLTVESKQAPGVVPCAHQRLFLLQPYQVTGMMPRNDDYLDYLECKTRGGWRPPLTPHGVTIVGLGECHLKLLGGC